MSVSGLIKVVEESGVQDGPGLRSVVFLKGCALRCKWCQNPELIDFRPEIWFHKDHCQKCGACKEVCPAGAIALDSEDKRIIRGKCLGFECRKCVEACPNDTYEVVGFRITAEDLYKHVEKFKPFYDRSDRGGVTLTGGDPLHQPEFTAEVLRLCQENHIHTAIESSLYAPYENLGKIAMYCNIILCDIKHMDSSKHKEGTGVSNELILENFKRLEREYEGEIVVRIPLIPGYSDDEDNVVRTLEFLYPLKRVKGVDLLPFNIFPIAKYKALFLDWEYEGVKRQSDEHLNKLKGIVDSYKRFSCTISGLW